MALGGCLTIHLSPQDQQTSPLKPDQSEPIQHQASSSKETSTKKASAHRKRGPAGFSSVEDLLHRLYIAISGVADQLQTNHAKDLRIILKDVFTICQSEPEPISPCKMDGSSSSAIFSEPPLISSQSEGTKDRGLYPHLICIYLI